jgi:hypothetical protein
MSGIRMRAECGRPPLDRMDHREQGPRNVGEQSGSFRVHREYLP